MEYVNSVKFDKWSSSDTSDQDERKKRASVSSTNSYSYHKKKSFEGPLSRSSSRKTNDMKKRSSKKFKKSEFERPTDFGRIADRFSSENNNNNDSGKNEENSFKDDQGDVFEEVEDDLMYNQSPKLKRSVSNAPSNDPSSWRRSALRIKRKAQSYSKIDEVPYLKNDRSRAKMSLQHPIVSIIQDEPLEVPKRNQKTGPKKKMSLQVPIPQRQSSSSPVSDNSPNRKISTLSTFSTK